VGALSVERTTIPGLLLLRLDVHRDARGWFAEWWQREQMTALGLPDFAPVQANVASNASRGTTRRTRVRRVGRPAGG
jgi:dTDP-4-dehydrorhamnose 3,5-epimerase/reductase